MEYIMNDAMFELPDKKPKSFRLTRKYAQQHVDGVDKAAKLRKAS